MDELNINLDSKELANQILNKRKRKPTFIFAIAIIVIIGVISSSLFTSKTVDLTMSTGQVKVKLMGSKNSNVSSIADLVYLTEHEIFEEWVTDSFYGEVKTIENIEITVGDSIDYRAIITFELLDPIKTTEETNKEVTILLPNQIGTTINHSESDYSSRLTVGTKAIILAKRYDESSIYQVNGSTLYLMELATFGLADGMRFCMLEDVDGTFRYTPDVFTSLTNGSNYQEIKNYIIKMME